MSILKDVFNSISDHVMEIQNPKPYEQWVREKTTLGGIPFTTAKYPFQKKILDDMHPNMDVIKISQVGISEIQIRKTLAMAYRNPNRTILFTLPSEDMRDRMVNTRVKPVLTENPVFQEGVTRDTIRSVEITQIKNSFVLFVPAGEKAATSVAADAVLNDEVDLCNPETLALFSSRMQASDWKLSQRFSTPTYTGFGIDLSFRDSDQQVYMYKCPHCNTQQVPEFNPSYIHIPNFPLDITNDLTQFEADWFDKYNIDLTKSYVHCYKCKKRADLGNSELRQWVATYQNRTSHRGYKISPFSSANLNPEYIITSLLRYKKSNFLRGWHNTVMGEAYDGGSERLSINDVNMLFTSQTLVEEYDPNFDYFIGYDVGTICHLVLMKSHANRTNETKFVAFEMLKQGELLERVKHLCNKYNVVAGQGDKYPEQILSGAIREATNNVVLPTRYENNKNPEPFKIIEDEYGQIDHVVLQRTNNFDNLFSDIRTGGVSISGYGVYKETIMTHFRDLKKVDVPEKLPIYEKLTGHDHFLHAAGYAYSAKRRYYGSTETTEEKTMLLFEGLNISLYNVENTLYGGKRR